MLPFSPDGCACAWTAALVLCCCAYHLLPPVLCDTDWRRQPYSPYNVSNFEQHSPYQQRHSYPPTYHHQPSNYGYFDNLVQRKRRVLSYDRGGDAGVKDFGNNLNYDDYENPLLVAYSHNPYAGSVKSTDFDKAIAGTAQRSPQPPGQETRGKRGVLHLYNMISCATSCDPISYKGYGCYCGFLGSGTALDGIDSCCRTHDQCYERLFCPFFTVYLQPYFWRCHRGGHPVCALENLSTRNQFVHGCAAQLCECDRRLAMCLRKYSCPRRPAICTSSPLRLLQNLIMIR